jgi:hypothetical protein
MPTVRAITREAARNKLQVLVNPRRNRQKRPISDEDQEV